MDLRSFLKKLEQEKKLIRIKKAVSHEFEAANIIYSLDEQPVLFDQIKGFDFPVFAGITSNRDIIAEGLDTTKEDLLFKLVESLKHPKKPDLVENAPCQKHVIMDPDLSKLPILHHLDGDGGRYLSASVCTMKDPDDGRNVSYHRMMQIGRNKLTARLIKKRQTRTTYDKIDGDLEMAVCLGSSVAVMVAASLGPPSDVDEFSIANALDETPLVKCKTKDLEVPAFSEIVLEGRLTRDLDREGPFVDLTETRDFERQEPVFVVDCITHRDNAMYQALIPGRFEHKTLMGMPKEPTIYNEVSKVADCKNVYVTLGGGSWLHAVVQIKKHHPDEPKKAIDASFKGHGSLKHVVVVDEDVDIYDSLAVEWAIATRFQADKDLVIKEKQPGSSLDPSGIHVPGEKTKTAKMGLDATIPEHVDKKNYEKVSYKLVDIDDYIR